MYATARFALSSKRSINRIAATGAILICVTALASAQNARVFVADSSNSRILSVQFDPPSSSVVIDEPNLLTQVRDIVIRDNGLHGVNLIVCDRSGGQLVFYQDASGPGQVIASSNRLFSPTRPDGVSIDPAGNLFVMNSGPGSPGGASQVWAIKYDAGCPDPMRSVCLPGGYVKPLGLIDVHVRIATQIGGGAVLIDTTGLPDSLISKTTAGILHAGDLLVLTNPAGLVRYAAADVTAFLDVLAHQGTPAVLTPETIIHPAESSVPSARRFPTGVVPSGMAFAPNGDLLIAVSDGRVLIYGRDGQRRSDGMGGFVDFTSGAGQGEFKIAVALQDGRNRAFVTHQQGGVLRRYTIRDDGTGLLDGISVGSHVPVGVDATTSQTVPAQAGPNVTVAPTTIMTSQIEQVLQSGAVNARVSAFPDPREAEQTIPDNQPLHRSLLLSELRGDLPPIVIPSYVRAFRAIDPAHGTPTFILLETDNSAAIAGLVEHHGTEEIILGYEPSCLDPDPTRRPCLFWSPDANDPPIVEGPVFIDVTSGCGSVRGITHAFSYFLVGARITGPLRTVVEAKLTRLKQVISGASCIQLKLNLRIQALIAQAVREFAYNRYAAVADALRQIDAEVEQYPQSFSACTANVSGEIQARARSAIYVLSRLP